MIHEIKEPLGESFARQVLRAYQILYGDGSYLQAAVKYLGNSNLDEAWSCLRVARDYFRLAKEAENEFDRDRHFRTCFDSLFHAARIASMIYLSIEETRWGKVVKVLLSQYQALKNL